MKRTLMMGLLIVALLVGAVSADPFIGNTLRYSIDVKDGCDITALGDTDVNWGTGDVTTTGAGSFGTMTTSGATTGAGATYSGIVIAEHFNSTDDIECDDDLDVGDDAAVGGDADVVGAFTAGSVASDAGVSGTTGTFTEPVTISKTTGTAPFVINSTTKNTNLNADLLDDHDSAYFGTVSNQTSQQTEIDALESNDTTHDSGIAANLGYIGNVSNLTTAATNATGAINELDSDLATVEAAYLSEMVINVPISASSVDQFVFISDGSWTITSVKENHVVAGNNASAVNFTVMVCDDGEAPDEGLMVHNSTVDLKATAKTIQEATLSGIVANVTVENNDTIAIDFQGVLTTLAGGTITIEMER